MESVKIIYHGHACFTLEAKGCRTVIDPYRHGMVQGLPNLDLEAEAVYCSHTHDDHAFSEAVNIIDAADLAPYTVEEYITPHDDQSGKLRGWNIARIFDFSGLRIAHLGDIGCFPDERLLNALKEVDCLLIPVGGTYTIDPEMAKRVVDAAAPTVCIPMHYRTDTTGFDVLAHLNDFTRYYPEIQECDNSFLLTKDAPNQILVIHYKP